MSFIDSAEAAGGPKDEWVPAEQRQMPSQSTAPKDEWVPAEQRDMPAKKMTWQDLYPVRVAKGIYNAAVSGTTLARDVLTRQAKLPSSEGIVPGSVPYGDPESSGERVADMAMLAMPPGIAARHGAGWMGVQKTVPVDAVSAEMAASQAAAREFDIPLSRGQASGDLGAIRYEDLASRGTYGKPAQERAAPFFEDQFQAVQDANRRIGEGFAGNRSVAGNASEAAEMINAELGARAAQARAANQAAQVAAEREAAATRGMVDDQGRLISDVVAEGRPLIENPREAGEIVGQAVRAAAARDRANYQGLYDEALGLPGQFEANAFEGIGGRIQGRLTHSDNPVIIDDVTTPITSRAIRDLENISGLRIQNRADPLGQPNPADVVAVDLRSVDQARKRLVAYYRSARGGQNAADARAAGRLIDEFDNEVEQAISNGLFSGDARALDAIQQARAAYARYAGQFRPRQPGDDVGLAMRRIIDRNATPEEIANMIVGSGRIGDKGLPVRISNRLEEVLGRDTEEWSSIRQAIWQSASRVRTEAGGVNTRGIDDLVTSSLGRRMFSPAERAAMRTHSTAVRNLEQTIENLGATRNAERSQAEYQRIFSGEGIGGQQGAVFRRIIDGTATTEETAQAIFSTISGNPGNARRAISAIEGIVGRDSETMAATRQGVWQKLTQNAETKDQPGQQKVSRALGEFLNGRGRSIATALYTPEEIAMMQRYQGVLKQLVIPKGARTNSDTIPALMSVLQRYSGATMTAIGTAVDGVTGGLAGYAVKALIGKGATAAIEARAASRVARSFEPVDLYPSQATGGMSPLIQTLSAGLTARGLANAPANPRRDSIIGSAHADEFDPTQLIAPEQPGTGERGTPIQLEAPDDVHYAAGGTAQPSEAQAAAGNYRKRHLNWKGLNISVETEMGGDRSGVGPDGVPWSTVMQHPYGYIKGSTGADDSQLDVYIGPHPHSQRVFVIDQADPETGKFDEHKIIIGAGDPEQAVSIYDSGFSDGSGPYRRSSMTQMTIPQLKSWISSGDTSAPLVQEASEAQEVPKGTISSDRFAEGGEVTLQELFDDPRKASEIKAERQKAIAMAGLQHTPLWQEKQMQIGRPFVDAIKGTAEAMAFPAQYAKAGVGIKTATPNVLTEEDVFRADDMARRGLNWGAKTAVAVVADPIPAGMALARGQSLRGSMGSVGSGAGPLYHGSPETALTSLNPSTRGPLGPGTYFSSLPGVAERYAGPQGRVYEVPAGRDVYRGEGHRSDAEWFGFKNDRERLVAAAEPDRREAVKAIVEKAWSGDGYPMFHDLSRLYGSKEAAQGLFKRAGFEGLSGQIDGPETLLFDSVSVPRAPAERIIGSAYKVGDQVFEGPIHAIAQENAMAALGIKKPIELIDRQPGKGLSERLRAHNAADGFVTSTGRFVSRKEAEAIANAGGQLPSTKSGRLGGMNAEDIGLGDNYARGGAIPLRKGTRLRAPKTVFRMLRIPKTPSPPKLRLPRVGKS